jgi:hypothetical protein
VKLASGEIIPSVTLPRRDENAVRSPARQRIVGPKASSVKLANGKIIPSVTPPLSKAKTL